MNVDPEKKFPQRECPGCAVEMPENHNRCPVCGYEFPGLPIGEKRMRLCVALMMLLLFIVVVLRLL